MIHYTSYGTHLGLAYIRRHGEHVERAVFTGVEGPDHTLKLPSTIEKHVKLVAELMANDPDVHAEIPDFLGLLTRLLGELDRDPVHVNLGSEGEIVLGAYDLQLYLSEAVGRVTTIRTVPRFFSDMNHGDFRRLARWATNYRQQPVGSSMSWAMDCASGASTERLARIKSETGSTMLGNAINFPFPDLCEAWGVEPLDETFRMPVVSDVPVLLISGALDGRTPLENAQEVAKGFPDAQHLLVERAGHEENLFSLAPGLKEALQRFFKGETLAMDALDGGPIEFAPIRTRD
jgi:pimeloyl-ACP methyl ester carboxylesterase